MMLVRRSELGKTACDLCPVLVGRVGKLPDRVEVPTLEMTVRLLDGSVV